MNLSFLRTTAVVLFLLTMISSNTAHASPAGTAESIDITVGAMQRHYLLYVPAGLPAHAPLLLAFHPSGSSGEKMRLMSGVILERLARERGVAIAYPDGFEGHFNDCRRAASFSARVHNIDDVGFARAMAADVARRIDIDPQRVFALGYSNGGHMAMRLSFETPELIAGAIVIAANPAAEDNNACRIVEGRKVAMVFIAGMADPINPYEGGDVNLFGTADRGNVMSAVDGAAWYAKRYGLGAQAASLPDLEVKDLTAHWRDWGGTGTMVRLIAIEEGGHTIPQAKFDFPASLMLGKTFRSDVPLESAFDAIGLKMP